MRALSLATMALLGMTTAAAALAQTPPGTAPDTGARPGHEPGVGESLPRSLPPSPLGDAAATDDYLRAARTSLGAGRLGEARQSLEMAETRALNRSVVQGQERFADDRLLISRIQDARTALTGGNNTHAIALIDLALTN